MRGSWGLMARVLGQMRPSTDPLSGPKGPRQRAHFGLIAANLPQRHGFARRPAPRPAVVCGVARAEGSVTAAQIRRVGSTCASPFSAPTSLALAAPHRRSAIARVPRCQRAGSTRRLLAQIGAALQQALLGAEQVGATPKARSAAGRPDIGDAKSAADQPQASCPQPPGRYGAVKAPRAALPTRPCARHRRRDGDDEGRSAGSFRHKGKSCPKRCRRAWATKFCGGQRCCAEARTGLFSPNFAAYPDQLLLRQEQSL
jgi:hypothetical protein